MRPLAPFFSCLLCLIGYTLSAQLDADRVAIQEALTQYHELDTEPQLMLLERSLQKSEAALGLMDTTTANVYRELSEYYYLQRDYELSLQYSIKQLNVFIKQPEHTRRLAEAYTLAARRQEKDLNTSKDYYQNSIDLLEDKNDDLNFMNYRGLALIAMVEGKYDLQIAYAQRAYDLSHTPTDKCEAMSIMFNGHARLKNMKQCLSNLEQRLALSSRHRLILPKSITYSNLGWLKILEKDYVNAIDNFNEALAILDVKETADIKDRETAKQVGSCLSNISNAYRKLNKPELSIQYAKRSIESMETFYGKKYSPDMGRLYHNLANKYAWQKDWEAALRHQQNAIKCFLNDETLTDIRLPINKENLYKVNYKWELLNSIKEKAFCYIFLYLKHGNREDMVESEKHFKNAVELIDIIRMELPTGTSKKYWQRKTRFIFNTAIEISEWLGDHEKVQFYMEKSRSIKLLDELNNKDAQSLIPAQLVEREEKLRGAFIDTKEKDLDKFTTYKKFLDSLQTSFPTYYKYRFDIETPTIAQVKTEVLEDSTQILQYHLTPDSLYILSITKTSSEIVTSPYPSSLSKDIKTLLSLLDNKDSLEYAHTYDRFTAKSNDLYKMLFEKIKVVKPQIIVIGDGPIDYLPFDVLINDVTADPPRFLIRDHTFSRAPSLAVLMKYRDHRRFDNILMVTPESYEDLGLTTLTRTQDEIQSLTKISDTRVLANEDASIRNFKALCSDYDVIHFSSHSGLDSLDQPWIAFKNATIQLKEIYKLQLNAALVTLSTCKSFDGESTLSSAADYKGVARRTPSGEGVNSLAKAFLFANASSVVGSAWDLNEASSFIILEDFYKGLKNGCNKADALRDAKLTYIDNNPYKSPFYWAPLGLVGDTSALGSDQSKFPFTIVVGILGLLTLIFLIVKRLRK